ncbi:MAG: heme exporter protein CcmB [Henriciella sp.]|nr:heme exporter protein CcmB [Henriciella sp.]
MNHPAPLLSAFRQALSEAWAGGAGVLLPFGFFAGTAVLVPFTIGSDPDLLARIGPGVLWLALALASLVTLERVFQADLQDGALDLWVQEDGSISLIAAVKTLAHWLISGLPLVLLTPMLGLMLQVPATQTVPAMAAYALGGLTFFLWGGVAAALSASVARGGLLIALIALPFYLPTVIFGTLALQEGLGGTSILFLAASTLFALGIAPAAMGAALRLAAD